MNIGRLGRPLGTFGIDAPSFTPRQVAGLHPDVLSGRAFSVMLQDYHLLAAIVIKSVMPLILSLV